jgi:hypothetical protein
MKPSLAGYDTSDGRHGFVGKHAKPRSVRVFRFSNRNTSNHELDRISARAPDVRPSTTGKRRASNTRTKQDQPKKNRRITEAELELDNVEQADVEPGVVKNADVLPSQDATGNDEPKWS